MQNQEAPRKFSRLRIFFILVCLFGGWIAFAATRPADTGENAKSVSWLPDYANNVSWYRTYSFTAYEFSATEEQFLQWIESRKVDQLTLTNATAAAPVRIARYCYLDTTISQQQRLAVISDGWLRHHEKSNGGGFWFAYDRSTGRAYYQYSPR